MKTIRRLYFYAVAFISVEVVMWGIISLLRSIFSANKIVNRRIHAGAGVIAHPRRCADLPCALVVGTARFCKR